MPDVIQEIKEELVKKKSNLFKEYLEKMNSKQGLEPIPLAELEKQEKSEFKVKTGTLIDEIIDGGIPENKSLMLYGEFRSGKTQTCLTMAVLCPNRVIYIDTEKSLRISRLKEICDARKLDWEKVRDKIVYFRPKDWIEQMLVIYKIPAPSDSDGKVDLIICDSISRHFRGIEFQGRETLQIKNGLQREFVFALERVAELHKAALVYTTQIYDTPNVNPWSSLVDTQKPIGGHSIEHQPDFILFFRVGKGNIRVVQMVDSSYTPLAERAFVITEAGIEDLPEDAEARKALEERAEKFSEKQAQEEIKKKSKKVDEEETE